MRTVVVTLLALGNLSLPLHANDTVLTQTEEPKASRQPERKNSALRRLRHNILETWESPQRDLYIPLNTWHNRWLYDDEHLARYNENPWGIGYGRSRYDADHDWHALYAMAFMDSNDNVQPIAGYAFQRMWTPGEQDSWRFGVGFTLSITARHEYNYIPMPLPLPLASIEYGRFSLQSAYVPGTYNNGNVLFTWLRWQL